MKNLKWIACISCGCFFVVPFFVFPILFYAFSLSNIANIITDTIADNLEVIIWGDSPEDNQHFDIGTLQYTYPTLGVVTQGWKNSGAVVGSAHQAWDIADTTAHPTPVRSFTKGKVSFVGTQHVVGTLDWYFCSVDDGVYDGKFYDNVCWFETGVYKKRLTGCGNYIVIKHENDLESMYCHLESTNVNKDDEVAIGQLIGLQGSTGYSTGKHLHFVLKYKGTPFDPHLFFKGFCTQNSWNSCKFTEWETKDE